MCVPGYLQVLQQVYTEHPLSPSDPDRNPSRCYTCGARACLLRLGRAFRNALTDLGELLPLAVLIQILQAAMLAQCGRLHLQSTQDNNMVVT